MKRVLRSEVFTLAGIIIITGLIAVPERCPAQQAHSTAAVTEKRVAQPEAAIPGGTAKGGSLASRIRTITRYAPLRETQTTIGLGTKYVRGVMGGLEQGASIGLGVQLTTADLLPVEFRITAIGSAKLYRRFQGEAYIPKFIDESTHADIWFDYIRRTKDNFFGIGPNTPTNPRTNFDVERRSYNAALYHDFNDHITLGGFFRLGNSSTYRGQRDTDVPIDDLYSGDPNTVPISNWLPGLMSNTKILSYGGFTELDYRDNSEGLTRGAFFYARVGSAQALKYDNLFSDYSWLDGELDARGYIPLGSDWTSLALRGYALVQRPRGGSQIPFYNMSYLGGRLHGRGFETYRFRANNLALGTIELRQTIWAQRKDRGLDIFGFGDAGQVWGDNRSTTDPAVLANQDFNWQVWKTSAGGGLQYRYSKALAGRVEIGHSNQGDRFYFSVSRGF